MSCRGNRRHIPRDQKTLLLTVSEHLTNTEIARVTHISDRTVRRVRELNEHTGDVANNNPTACRPRILENDDITYMLSRLDQRPGTMLDELREGLEFARGVYVSEATISCTLGRQNYSSKQISRTALEANPIAQAEFILTVGNHIYRPNMFVFVDEAAVNRHTAQRRCGYAPVGMRAEEQDHFVRGIRYTLLPALALEGVVHLDIFDYPGTADLFNIFIRRLLEVMNPWPGPNSVIVLDNSNIHYSNELDELVAARGCRILYLPPYSPRLNPIELMFSEIKARIRRQRNFILGAMNGAYGQDTYALLWEIVYEVTPEMAAGWFRHCGYL